MADDPTRHRIAATFVQAGGMDDRPDHPTPYPALDGTDVTVPAPPPLPDGPMPKFGTADLEWLDRLIAFRDRAVANDIGAQTRRPDPRAVSGMDMANREAMENWLAQAEVDREALAAGYEAAAQRCEARFGADGRGYLDALADGSALTDFWGTLDTLLYQRIPLMEYHAPDMQGILHDLLSRFPMRVWLPIVAQKCFPLFEFRKADRLNALLARFLEGPCADFRHLETGAEKPQTETDLAPAIRRELLTTAFRILSATARFKRLTDQDGSRDAHRTTHGGEELARLLRGTRAETLTPVQLDLVEELFREIEPARAYEEGQTRSEINLVMSAAFDHTMQAQVAGRPQGFYLRAYLSTRPPGFSVVNLASCPRHMIWPYLATHFDILDRAMGLSDPFWFEPRFERRKAIELIALMPKTPARYGDVLFETATGPGAGGRATAQSLLAGGRDYVAPAVERLSNRRAGVRKAAAETLAAIGDPAALPALEARARVETSAQAATAVEDAVRRLAGVRT